MADPKGIYFGGGNSGLATILNSNQTAQTQQRLDAQAQRKIAEQVRAKEEKDKRANELKQADIWRMYQPSLQQEFQSIVDDVKNDKIDLFEMRTRLADYAGKAKSSLDLKGEYDQTIQDYEKKQKGTYWPCVRVLSSKIP